MEKKLQDKIKLFRILHDVNRVYLSKEGQLFVKKPENFTGKDLWWYKSGQLRHEDNYKNGEYHGISFGWHSNGNKCYEDNYKNGEIID